MCKAATLSGVNGAALKESTTRHIVSQAPMCQAPMWQLYSLRQAWRGSRLEEDKRVVGDGREEDLQEGSRKGPGKVQEWV